MWAPLSAERQAFKRFWWIHSVERGAKKNGNARAAFGVSRKLMFSRDYLVAYWPGLGCGEGQNQAQLRVSLEHPPAHDLKCYAVARYVGRGGINPNARRQSLNSRAQAGLEPMLVGESGRCITP